jgi:hypothetical protein
MLCETRIFASALQDTKFMDATFKLISLIATVEIAKTNLVL